MVEEEWAIIREFPDYQISTLGRVLNTKRNTFMSTTVNNYGHLRISLRRGPFRATRSVSLLVALAFVEAPEELCDSVMVLNGDLTDVRADNLTWRPWWFVITYSRQLKKQQPMHYHNLHVQNTVTGEIYSSIVEAGMSEGLLFRDIWESTYKRKSIYPTDVSFKVIERVLFRT